jgi:hypothetical protein
MLTFVKVKQGSDISFYQQLVVLDPENSSCGNFGPVRRHYQCTPSIDSLLDEPSPIPEPQSYEQDVNL